MNGNNSILPLSVRDLGFAPDGRPLLSEISFAIERGGLTAVIGPNGAGKSLLLRLCHGLLRPTTGAIRWAAGDGIIAGRKRHAMVFQRPVMLRRSASANISHALTVSGWPADSRRERATAALQRFGLADFAERPARLLSFGEQQRLAIARAWALSPDVIFLDEPCSQLDPGATRQVETMLAELVAEGVTIVMATHDLAQSRRLATSILFLHGGRLVEAGPPAALFDRPRTAEARAFIAGELLW